MKLAPPAASSARASCPLGAFDPRGGPFERTIGKSLRSSTTSAPVAGSTLTTLIGSSCPFSASLASMPTDEIQVGRRSVRVTHPERVLFPRDGVTKGDLAEYYAEIGDVIVPHLRERPFTLKRYPHGIDGQPYFHKQAPKGKPSWIPTRRFRTWPRAGESRLVDFTLVNEPAALVWM